MRLEPERRRGETHGGSAPGLLARDAYRTWKKRVQTAEAQIRVFTPYFDTMLSRLLGNATVDVAFITVVTDMSPTSGALSYRRQLIGLRSLLRQGVEVRSLPRLHAKVLVTDGAVVLGSQNFTTYARASKEATAAIRGEVSDKKFLAQLDEWLESSEPVDLQLIEALLDRLAPQIANVDSAVNELAIAYESVLSLHKLRRFERIVAENRERIAGLPVAAEIRARLPVLRARTAARRVHAQLDYVPWRWEGGGAYWTLKVARDSTFTSWWVNGRGQPKRLRLTRLRYYPLLLSATGAMAYGRVGDTVITYITRNVNFTQPLYIAGHSVRVSVSFPPSGRADANMKVRGRVDGGLNGEFTIWLRIAAAEPLVTGVEFHRETWARSDEGARAVADLIVTQKEYWDRFLDRILSNFKLSEIGLDNHNANQFFRRGRSYWVEPVLIGETPMLVLA